MSLIYVCADKLQLNGERDSIMFALLIRMKSRWNLRCKVVFAEYVKASYAVGRMCHVWEVRWMSEMFSS
jgi:hypothetical protein